MLTEDTCNFFYSISLLTPVCFLSHTGYSSYDSSNLFHSTPKTKVINYFIIEYFREIVSDIKFTFIFNTSNMINISAPCGVIKTRHICSRPL